MAMLRLKLHQRVVTIVPTRAESSSKRKVHCLEYFDLLLCQLGLETLFQCRVFFTHVLDPAEKVKLFEVEHYLVAVFVWCRVFAVARSIGDEVRNEFAEGCLG